MPKNEPSRLACNLILHRNPAPYQCCHRAIWKYNSSNFSIGKMTTSIGIQGRDLLWPKIGCEGHIDLVLNKPCKCHIRTHSRVQLLVSSSKFVPCLQSSNKTGWQQSWKLLAVLKRLHYIKIFLFKYVRVCSLITWGGVAKKGVEVFIIF